ncbi:metallophosphoesterase [Romboutsia sp.]|uniref:metallophosphoesterase n=1 Tax=Romboutsia sp. TaxID=1965302 RepID=UPI003F2C7DBC
MKIGVISDTHGIKVHIDKAIPHLKNCDLIIHAGDNFSDSKYVYNETKVNIIAVKGNCDFERDVEDELIFEAEDKSIFLCHGDKYGVKYGIEEIEIKAKSINADIVIFGHTHVPLSIEKDGILYINPGSVSFPRRVSYKSIVMMSIEDGNINIEEIKI